MLFSSPFLFTTNSLTVTNEGADRIEMVLDAARQMKRNHGFHDGRQPIKPLGQLPGNRPGMEHIERHTGSEKS
jgi:hypothetical protein